jgi:hypothetical protein
VPDPEVQLLDRAADLGGEERRNGQRENQRDASPTVLPSPLDVIPERRATQDQRRAVGLLLIATSIAIETAIVLFWLRTFVHVGATGAPRFFALVYVVAAPFVGLGMLGWFAARAIKARAAA